MIGGQADREQRVQAADLEELAGESVAEQEAAYAF